MDHFFQLDRNRYTLFARNRRPVEIKVGQPRGPSTPDLWEHEIDVRVGAMAMTGAAVFVAGAGFVLLGAGLAYWFISLNNEYEIVAYMRYYIDLWWTYANMAV